MKCQSSFSGKNKANAIHLSSAEYAQRMAKVQEWSQSSILLKTHFLYLDTKVRPTLVH